MGDKERSGKRRRRKGPRGKWARFLIIRYIQNVLKDIRNKCNNETYKRITIVHFDDIKKVQNRQAS